METIFSLLQGLIRLLFNPLFFVLFIYAIARIRADRKYKKGAYFQVTKLPYTSVKRDLGRYGEYLTYEQLKHYEEDGAKFLFNIYIPKGNGETTEIDVLMIYKKGLFVFESKNYSGWIFGDEKQKQWYQTLPTGWGSSQKESFYNPIMQNRSHIKHLGAFLAEPLPMRSIIVFSERCTLKNGPIYGEDISVINRDNVEPLVSAICERNPKDLLTIPEIDKIYQKLYPFTQLDEIAKQEHIANIRNTLNNQGVQKKEKPPIQPVAPNQLKTDEKPVNPVSDNVDVVKTEPVPEEITPTQEENTAPQVMKCPKCGGDMVLRTATKGANAGKCFYGCSNYPKCRYIQNVINQEQKAAPAKENISSV